MRQLYMIEHTLYYMGKFLFVKKFQHLCYGPQTFLPGPARSLVDFNLRQCTFMLMKQSLYSHLTWFFWVNKCFMPFGQGCCTFKSQKIFYFDQVIVQNQSWTICWLDIAKKSIRNRHVVMVFFENFLYDYYSACKYLQLPCFKVIF